MLQINRLLYTVQKSQFAEKLVCVCVCVEGGVILSSFWLVHTRARKNARPIKSGGAFSPDTCIFLWVGGSRLQLQGVRN